MFSCWHPGPKRLKFFNPPFWFRAALLFFFWLRWVLVAVCGLSCPEACGTRASSTGASYIVAVSLELDGRFFTTGPPGKSLRALLLLCNYSPWISYHYLKGARGIFPSFQPAAHRRFSSCRLNAGPQQVPMNTTPSTIRCAPGRGVGSTWKQEDRAVFMGLPHLVTKPLAGAPRKSPWHITLHPSSEGWALIKSLWIRQPHREGQGTQELTVGTGDSPVSKSAWHS